ncbi:MAG: UDP-N-acetylglucosamine--N-acetylmuramyl-(pentapeptide) pyrophosphoryl-undecaprenol N-acetylglucosamine transferase [Candidatus Azambacteria bacterium]|nr:UDP-N-acetylglucosamine--N-acetylmuramyl-(pentapeptide) pyrophosphoryl-undecaprenol N-acetylglucosamine transferase [Candidatus Azambacteria bacterium]
MIRIVLTGGGTGGHLFPLVAVSRKLNELARSSDLGEPEIYYLGPGLFLESSLEREEMNFHYKIIMTGKWRRYFSFKNFIDFFKIGIGLLQALYEVWRIMPDVIFSKGGYGSFGPVIAGWIYRIPIILHDSDSVPGLTNKILARFALLVAISFNEAADHFPKNKTYFTGEAIRDAFFLPPKPETERPLLHLTSQRPTMLILGGSQGAQKINDIVLDILPDLLNMAEVIHQTGDENYLSVLGESKVALAGLSGELLASYHPVNFLVEPEYIAAYHSADLVISRSGAGSIFEIAASGKASIIIPITDSANNHQRKNAYIFASDGRAEVIEESNLTPRLLMSVIGTILNNPGKKKSMEEKARKFATPDAAKLIAQALLNLIPR